MRGKSDLRRLLAMMLIVAGITFVPAYWWAPDRFGAWAGGLQAVSVVIALVYAALQLAHSASSTKVDRTIRLHEDFSTGEVGAARHRLSSFLYTVASDKGHPGQTYRPSDAELAVGEALRHYGPTANGNPSDPYVTQDVHQLLWFFQRVGAARRHGLVDGALLRYLFGWHILRWNATFERISAHDVEMRADLANLADWVRDSAEPADLKRWLTRLDGLFNDG